MTANGNHSAAPPPDGAGTAPSCSAALAETSRALKAITFYPEGHPLREGILHRSYRALAGLLGGGSLSLVVQRGGILCPDREGALDGSPAVTALARELFSREIQRLTLLPDFSPDDYSRFLSLLAMEPQEIAVEGGFTGLLEKRGIRNVVANEIDISAVFTKKRVGETSEQSAAELTAAREAEEQESSQSEGEFTEQVEDISLDELLPLMSAETDDSRYRRLVGLLLVKGKSLVAESDFDRLYPLLFALLDQHADGTKSDARRGSSLMVFQQLARGEMTEHLLGHLEEKEFGQQEFVYLILQELGVDAVDAVIRRLVAAESPAARNTLSTALLRIGPPALPALTGLLGDGRWQVVRTAAAILGEMGSREAVKGLRPAAHHGDIRVRLEAVRALAKIGGSEATAELIALMGDDDQAVGKQAIAWLGNTRNQKALQPLLQVACRRDLAGSRLELRKEALTAIGHIGDRQAIDPLARLARKRHWLMPDRQLGLQVLAVGTIARLGGESSREQLEKLAARGGRIGRACTAALESMGQRTANSHE